MVKREEFHFGASGPVNFPSSKLSQELGFLTFLKVSSEGEFLGRQSNGRGSFFEKRKVEIFVFFDRFFPCKLFRGKRLRIVA